MDRQRCAVCNENHILTTICLFHALERERERMWQNPLQVDPSAEEPPPQPWEGNAYETGLSFQGSQAAARSLPEQPFGLGALNQQGQEEARKTYHSLQVVNRDNFSGHLGFNSSPSQNAFPSISNSGENIAGFLQNRFPQSNGTNSHLVQPQANLPQSSPVWNRPPIKLPQNPFPNQGAERMPQQQGPAQFPSNNLAAIASIEAIPGGSPSAENGAEARGKFKL
ncbi:Hypothetical predicted protein [Cloeon dipterum]|uniref:Uncharacterized protein n=1 Tax=Cloeon dipterum TaxID=197152 RepID=A0A8S1DJA9_9INSE|nr:Hypothetical predicted protein [Cloeon dipterum]